MFHSSRSTKTKIRAVESDFKKSNVQAPVGSLSFVTHVTHATHGSLQNSRHHGLWIITIIVEQTSIVIKINFLWTPAQVLAIACQRVNFD